MLLEPYPAWKPVVAVGRLPGIRHILPIGYNFVAANRRFVFGPANRVYWLKIIISLGFLFGLLLSPALWVSTRFYPLTPVLNGLPPIPYPFDWIFLVLLSGALVGIIASSRPRPFYLARDCACIAAWFFLIRKGCSPGSISICSCSPY